MEENNFKEDFPNESMATLWQRVLSGAFGGALITGGLWFYTAVTTNKWLSVVLIGIGIYAIFYGRNLR